MRSCRRARVVALALVLGSSGLLAFATRALAEPLNLVANPGFESGTAGWMVAATASIDAAAGNAHSGTSSLRLDATEPWQGTWQGIPVTGGQTYTFSGWARSTTSGAWVSIASYDATGVALEGSHLDFPGTGSWTYVSGTFPTSPGAVLVGFGAQSSTTGTFWFDDLSVAQAPAVTPSPTPTVAPTPPPTVAGALPRLQVAGNHLVEPSGRIVVLRGVNRSGGEFMCVQGAGVFQGPVDVQSVLAIKAWQTNAVRLPLNEDCWLGINGVAGLYSGAAYRQAVADYVRLLNQNGLYAILDLHWNAPGAELALSQQPMPDRDHAADFWTQVATAFKNDPGVIFDLFNEPYPDSNRDTAAAWTCWRDGGTCPGVSFVAAGMQELVDAVRGTGAKNVIAVPGVQFSNTLTGWLQYRPTDRLNNLVASWHTYQWAWCVTVACYESNVGALGAEVPVIAQELGEDNCDAVWFEALLSWLDAREISYSAWTWNIWGPGCETISLISDYAGTPTTYGRIYQSHLAALPAPGPGRRIAVKP